MKHMQCKKVNISRLFKKCAYLRVKCLVVVCIFRKRAKYYHVLLWPEFSFIDNFKDALNI